MAKHHVLHLCARLGRPALVVGLCLVTSTGCVRWMRDADFYTEELGELIEARHEAIEACYDRYVEERDPAAKGELTLEFDVLAKTGEVAGIEVVDSTVPEPLARCVTDELATLKLEPVDVKTAHATYTWQFVLGSRKKPPVDPFAGAQEAVLACYGAHLREVDREAAGDLVVDYELSPETGEVTRFEVIAEDTTAPASVVECASAALRGARIDPGDVEGRNVSGRRSFALRFVPYDDEG